MPQLVAVVEGEDGHLGEQSEDGDENRRQKPKAGLPVDLRIHLLLFLLIVTS